MFDRKRSFSLLRPGAAAVLGTLAAIALSAALFTSAASAATVTLSGPQDPLTNCTGDIAKDASGVNQLDYTFSCAALTSANTGAILSYDILAVRQQDDLNNIQNFNGTPNVYYAKDNPLAADYSAGATGPSAETVDPLASSVLCPGESGTDGFSCYAGAPSVTNDGYIPEGDYIEGSLNLDEPYCPYLVEGSKPGTPAVPRATIELVVTDSTGAEDGPFELDTNKGCAKVPAVTPAFALSSVKVSGASVTLKSDLPFTGKLAATLVDGSKTVGTESKKVTKSGSTALTVKLNAAGKNLAKKSELKVSVKATYTPTDGHAEKATKTGIKIK